MIQTSRNCILVPFSTVMPAVAHPGGDLRVARRAERLKVGVDVCPSAREREPVMDLGRGRVDTALQTLFAERVGGDVAVADALPRAAVPFFLHGVAVILFVLLVDELLVLLAVAAGHQLRAARIAAGR